MADVEVIPAGVLDSSHATDSIIVTGWVMDMRLNSDTVQNAWEDLVSTWPILVSRLARNVQDGRWEYHVSKSTQRAQQSFGVLLVSGSIHEHYKYSTPADTIQCTIKENPFYLFVPGAPSSVKDMLKRDVPLTCLHVTLFDDATLIGLSTPHILCDGYGVKTIIEALSSIINGRGPPPPLVYTDPFKSYAESIEPKEPPPFWRVLNKMQTFKLILYTIWDWLWSSPIENRDIFFPAETVVQLKNQAIEDIQKGSGPGEELMVSSSDVILAFCLKCIYPSTTSTRPLNVFYTANLRRILPGCIPRTFIQNAVCMVVTPTLPLSAISEMSLGGLALHIRRTLQSQTTIPAVERWLRWHIGTSGRIRTFFEPGSAYKVVTNWRDMRLMEVDFSGALPDVSCGIKPKCRYMWGNGIQPTPLRDWVGLWADDPSGGIWVSAFLPRNVWRYKEGFGRFIVP